LVFERRGEAAEEGERMKPEQQRLVDYLERYLENSEPVSVQPAPLPDPNAAVKANAANATATANKTIQSRRTKHGSTTMTKAGMKKVKGNSNG
jgi:hypothetical protein